MHCNLIRPGYAIGNPVVPGAAIYSDARFRNIVRAALAGAEIRVVQNDGTQFIWAGDLARIYSAVLHANPNRAIYFGLAQDFTTWEAIARQTVQMTDSPSRIIVEDKGHGAPHLFDLGRISREFGLSFTSAARITEHLEYLIRQARSTA